MKKNKTKDSIYFKDYLEEQLKDPVIRKWYDYYGKQLEIAMQVNKLRKERKLSQKQLASKLGTTQSNIARIEAGNQNLTVGMLNKIADVFDRKLKIEFTR